VSFPARALVCVTGVSGSGKSTLVHDVLYAALLKAKGKPTEAPDSSHRSAGNENVGDIVLVDQSRSGARRAPKPGELRGRIPILSRPVRARAIARRRLHGTYSHRYGRCPTCSAWLTSGCSFLSDVYLRCADCDGRRYRMRPRSEDHGRNGRFGSTLPRCSR